MVCQQDDTEQTEQICTKTHISVVFSLSLTLCFWTSFISSVNDAKMLMNTVRRVFRWIYLDLADLNVIFDFGIGFIELKVLIFNLFFVHHLKIHVFLLL